MNTRILHHIVGRLSLRPAQAESFSKLVRALEASLQAAPMLDLQRACPENHCLRHSPAMPVVASRD